MNLLSGKYNLPNIQDTEYDNISIEETQHQNIIMLE